MSIGESSGPIHPVPTRNRNHRYRYLFSDKHHGKDRKAARWLPELSRDDEFAVFDDADFHEIVDDHGWIYGIRSRGEDDRIPDLGIWGEQIAEFPFAREGQPWHGYPLWALGTAGPQNRKKQKFRPSKDVFQRMESANMIRHAERIRLNKGDHI